MQSENGMDIEVLKPQKVTKSIGSVNKLFVRKYWTKEYIDDKIRLMPQGKHKLLVLTMWMTGLRVSEVVNIKKKDVDFNSGFMKVMWLKNRKWKERIIPVKKELLFILETYTMGMLSDDKLFPFSRQHVHRLIKRNLGGYPHMLRHSFARNYLLQGGRERDLKDLLGHKYISTTAEYGKLVPMDLAKEIEKITF